MSFRQRSFLLRRGIFFLFQHGIFMFSTGYITTIGKIIVPIGTINKWQHILLV